MKKSALFVILALAFFPIASFSQWNGLSRVSVGDNDGCEVYPAESERSRCKAACGVEKGRPLRRCLREANLWRSSIPDDADCYIVYADHDDMLAQCIRACGESLMGQPLHQCLRDAGLRGRNRNKQQEGSKK